MSGIKKDTDPPIAPVEEDPNAAIVCSSPPCLMHELDPSYLGYLGRDEVSALLNTLLAADWGGIVPDEGAFRARLGRHLGALGGSAAASGDPARSGEPPDPGPDRLARMIRDALPRAYDDALRGDLKEALDALEHARPDRG